MLALAISPFIMIYLCLQTGIEEKMIGWCRVAFETSFTQALIILNPVHDIMHDALMQCTQWRLQDLNTQSKVVARIVYPVKFE